MNSPEISIIVPVYNVFPYLTDCVNSILAQTFSDFECILIDDGSTDGSGALCDSLQTRDARLRVIHQKNGGLSAARNSGLDAAKGKFIAFVDSDDLIAPQYLELLLEGIRVGGKPMAVCRYVRFDDGQTPECLPVSLRTSVWDRSKSFWELSQASMDGRAEFVTVAWNKLYDRSLFQDLRFPLGKLHEDEWIIHELLLRSDGLCCVDCVLYHYRQRSSSITGSAQMQNPRHLEALDAFRQRCEIDELRKEPALYMHTVTHYFEMMVLSAFQLELSGNALRQLLTRYRKDLAIYHRYIRGKRWYLFAVSPHLYRKLYWK